jgi:hypothetical protein
MVSVCWDDRRQADNFDCVIYTHVALVGWSYGSTPSSLEVIGRSFSAFLINENLCYT